MMQDQEFEAVLTARGPGGAWIFLPVPFDVESAFGSKAQVMVAGTINGFAFRNSLLPQGDGTHAMMVGKDLQAGAGAKAGDKVRVIMRRDDEERTVEAPDDLRAALAGRPRAEAFFAGLTASQKKEYVDWIVSAKQAATREARIAKALDHLEEGKKRLR
jgi:hypothetical protein